MIGIKKSSARLHLSKMSGACGTRGGEEKQKQDTNGRHVRIQAMCPIPEFLDSTCFCAVSYSLCDLWTCNQQAQK